MNLDELLQKRRSYRALKPIEITNEHIQELAKAAQIAPSCSNNQPWNFVFVYEKQKLEELFDALSEGNQWAKRASLIIVIFSKKELDCIAGSTREYFSFDTGLASAFMLLQLVDMGLVGHPIAGYSQRKTKKILNIPDDMTVIAMIIVGKHSEDISFLSETQQKTERNRPKRKPIEEFIYHNSYTK